TKKNCFFVIKIKKTPLQTKDVYTRYHLACNDVDHYLLYFNNAKAALIFLSIILKGATKKRLAFSLSTKKLSVKDVRF
ncbi:MAG: hypothetical protein L0J45_07115, partial [Psychroflexus sp.]|nr:hypothetical protein [Psychroflexus sp.]